MIWLWVGVGSVALGVVLLVLLLFAVILDSRRAWRDAGRAIEENRRYRPPR